MKEERIEGNYIRKKRRRRSRKTWTKEMKSAMEGTDIE